MTIRTMTLGLLLATLVATPAWGVVWRVPGQFTDIQTALNDPLVQDGDEIELAAGTTYDGFDFVGKAVRIYGDPDAPDWVTPPRIVPPAPGAAHCVICDSGEDPNSIVEGVTIGRNAETQACARGANIANNSSPTFRNCTFEDNCGSSTGGAVTIAGGAPVFEGCRFLDNNPTGSRYGGAVHISAGARAIFRSYRPTGEDPTPCRFEGNTASLGGAVFIDNAAPVFEDCVFDGNSVHGAAGGNIDREGGAVRISGSAGADPNDWPAFVACTFNANECHAESSGNYNGARYSASWGGAVALVDANARFELCSFSQNLGQATTECYWTHDRTARAFGGAVSIRGGSQAAFVTCTFTGNHTYASVACDGSNRWSHARGGAVYCQDAASPAFQDGCTFDGNWVETGANGVTYAQGGAAHHRGEDTDPQYIGCSFSNNIAKAGGAVFNTDKASPVFMDCHFVENEATSSEVTEGGGAICNVGGEDLARPCECVLTQCTFVGNTAPRGGAVFEYWNYRPGAVPNGRSQYLSCEFRQNSATGGDPNDGGGAVRNYSSPPYFFDCTFEDNQSQAHGGALANFPKHSFTTLDACTLMRNHADSGFGGAIYNAYNQTQAQLIDCQIRENTAQHCGGVYNDPNYDPLLGIGSSMLQGTTLCGNTPSCPDPNAQFCQIEGYWDDEGDNSFAETCASCRGDMNCDGRVDWRDIDFFVAGQNDNESAWVEMHVRVYGRPPTCTFGNGDIGGPYGVDVPDLRVDWRDIDGFVALQNTYCP